MGFAWSFLEWTTAFSKAGDWVTIFAMDEIGAVVRCCSGYARDVWECRELEECGQAEVESRTNAGERWG